MTNLWQRLVFIICDSSVAGKSKNSTALLLLGERRCPAQLLTAALDGKHSRGYSELQTRAWRNNQGDGRAEWQTMEAAVWVFSCRFFSPLCLVSTLICPSLFGRKRLTEESQRWENNLSLMSMFSTVRLDFVSFFSSSWRICSLLMEKRVWKLK